MQQTKPDVRGLIRPDIEDMEPYKPIVPFDVLSEQLGRPTEQIIKLDANENPYGPSPKALEALTTLQQETPIYPDPMVRRLRGKLAAYLDVPKENILCGAGADELIDLIMRLFISPGDVIVNCPPTFGMYTFDADLVAAKRVSVPRRPDFSLDVDAVERAILANDAKLIFLASPNNPDGGLLPDAALKRLLALPVVIVLDEAYVEFSEAEPHHALPTQHNNLIVLRTFSKWAGLAGLRIGYGVFPQWIMTHMWKIKQPYNVNVAADAAARASLDDLPRLIERVERIKAERERLYATLEELEFLHPYPSQANFILCRVTGIEAGELKRRLAEDYGILIRYYRKPGLDDHVRLTVGTSQQTSALLAALQGIRESL